MAEAAVGATAYSAGGNHTIAMLGFTFLALLSVLSALLLMFHRNPAFLIVESRNLIDLVRLQDTARRLPAADFRKLLLSSGLRPELLADGEVDVEDPGLDPWDVGPADEDAYETAPVADDSDDDNVDDETAALTAKLSEYDNKRKRQ